MEWKWMRFQCTHFTHFPRNRSAGCEGKEKGKRECVTVESHHLKMIYAVRAKVTHQGFGWLWRVYGNSTSTHNTHPAACQNLHLIPGSAPLKSKTNFHYSHSNKPTETAPCSSNPAHLQAATSVLHWKSILLRAKRTNSYQNSCTTLTRTWRTEHLQDSWLKK